MNAEQKAEALRLADALSTEYEPRPCTLRDCEDLLRTLTAEPQFPPDYPDGPDREPEPQVDDAAWRATLRQHPRKHVTDGSPCWCLPDVDYIDPETGAKVIVHKEVQ